MGRPGSNVYEERYRLTLELFAAGEAIMRQNLRRRYPDAGPAEIEVHLDTWLHSRPGAAQGDAMGRPGTWPRHR